MCLLNLLILTTPSKHFNTLWPNPLFPKIRNYRVIFSILFCLSSFGVAADNDRGLIWKYQKDGRHSYLFGSIHFANSGFYPFSQPIIDAFNESDVLIVEVDESLTPIEKRQALLKRYGIYPDGETIHDHLSQKTIAEFRKLFNHFQVPLTHFETYRPGLLSLTLTALQAQSLGYSAEQGMDRYFLQKSRFKKHIRQIEDFAFQMSLLKDLPNDEALLNDSIKNMRDYKTHWEGTINAWKQGAPNELYELAIGKPMREHPRLEPFFDVLFFSRHDKMVSEAERCLKQEEVCFIVVGAGHLVGDKGVVKQLQRQGFEVNQL